MRPLQKGIFGFLIFVKTEKKAGMETDVYKMMLKSNVVTFKK